MEPHQTRPPRPKPRRRFLRFSLRGLLVLVAVCSVWLGIAFHRAREQARAVAIIKAHSGYVMYDYNRTGTGFFDARGRSGIPQWLLNSLGEDFFHDVLFVDANEVTDDALEVICELREIRRLFLDGAAITNNGMAHVKALDKLEALSIDLPNVDDEGLVHLSTLPVLRELEIIHAAITDGGLEHVRRFSRLEWLLLQDTQVTAVGARTLHEAMPSCAIFVFEGIGPVFCVSPELQGGS